MGGVDEVTGVRTVTQIFTPLPAGSHYNCATTDSLSLSWCACHRAGPLSWELNCERAAPVCGAFLSGLAGLLLKPCLLLFTLVSTAAVFKAPHGSLCSLLVTSALFISFHTKEMNGLL